MIHASFLEAYFDSHRTRRCHSETDGIFSLEHYRHAPLNMPTILGTLCALFDARPASISIANIEALMDTRRARGSYNSALNLARMVVQNRRPWAHETHDRLGFWKSFSIIVFATLRFPREASLATDRQHSEILLLKDAWDWLCTIVRATYALL